MLRRLGVLAVVTLVATTGCTGGKPPAAPSASRTTPPAAAGPQTFSVTVDASNASFPIAADAYFPDHLQVHPGDTIRFNEVFSGEPHTVTLGTLVDAEAASEAVTPTASPTPSALPSFFPKPGRGGDPVPSAAQPCFLDTGTPPATTLCPPVPQPAFSGGQAFYSSGWLAPTSTFSVPLSPTINPGTYTVRCLVHPTMTGRIEVVPPAQRIPPPGAVAAAGSAQVAAVVAALTPAARDAAAVTATNVAGITVGAGVTNTLVTTFGPPELDVSVSQTMVFNLFGTHAIAVNPPDNAVGLLTKGADGVVHFNTTATRSIGGESPPSGVQARPRSVFGGIYPGSGFHNSGLLTSYPPGLLSYNLQFTTPGTFTLRCLVHPAMRASVVVSAP